MKIVVISPSSKSLQEIRSILERGNPSRVVSCHEGGLTKVRNLADQEGPNVIIVEGLCRDSGELNSVEFLTTKYPQLVVIMLCSHQTPEFLIKAMRAGVREVLPSPLNSVELEAAIARVESKMGLQNQHSACIMAFLSCKGGMGATFLAANLGYQLASKDMKVLLMDLNLQFGEAVITVHDRKAGSDIAEVARNVSRLDASFLSASTVQIAPNFEILSAPEDPTQSLQIKPEHLEAILNVAANHYDYIILDVARSLDDLNIKALDRAQKIFLIAQTMLPCVRNIKQLTGVFRSLGYPSDKVELVVNRHTKNAEIGLHDLRATLNIDHMRTIPNRYAEVSKAVNQGRPLAAVSTSSVVLKAIDEWAQSLLPQAAPVQSGLFSRLLSTKRAN